MTRPEGPQPLVALTGLPTGGVDRLTRPFARFLRIETIGAALLLLVTLGAVAVANSSWGPSFSKLWEIPFSVQVGAYGLTRTLRSVINEGLMTLFFFLLALELKRELVLGELRNPRIAALSIAGAMGGMFVPAAIYLVLMSGRPGAPAWGMVVATDTAFVIGALALLGKRVPQSLRLFMLSVTVVDDLGSIFVVALGYSDEIAWTPLALAVGGVAVVFAMSRMGFRGFPAYVLMGSLAWLAADASGIQPTVTGMVFGLMTPARRWVDDQRLYAILAQVVAHPTGGEGSADTEDRRTLQVAEVAAREALSPLERLQIMLHPWVGFVVLPLFALANAGFALSSGDVRSTLFSAVFVSFTVGKPLGVVAFSWLAVRSGIAIRPPDLGWRLLVGGGMLAGIGFTMPLFIADLALATDLIGTAKLSVLLASTTSAVVGLSFLVSSTPRRREARNGSRPARTGPP